MLKFYVAGALQSIPYELDTSVGIILRRLHRIVYAAAIN